MNTTQTSLLEDAQRTITELDSVASELTGLVIELRTLLEQLGEIEEKLPND